MYKKVSTDLKFVDREKETEIFWEENNIFEKMMDLRQPTANRISVMY